MNRKSIALLLIGLLLIGCGTPPPAELEELLIEADRYADEADSLWMQRTRAKARFQAIVNSLESQHYDVKLDGWPERIQRIYRYDNRELVYER